MSNQANCEAMETLSVIVLGLPLTGSSHSLIRLPEFLDVGVVRSELTVCSDASAIDFNWQIRLLREGL